MKTKFIVVDGIDGAGKSTLIEDIKKLSWNIVQIEYPKTMPSGKLTRFNDERSFELMFTLFELLDKNKIYLLDRFMVSNLVYDVILRGEDPSVSKYYLEEFKKRFDVMEIYLTRNQLGMDFEDDRIKMTSQQFNQLIEEYKKYGRNYHIVHRDSKNKIVSIDSAERDRLFNEVDFFLDSMPFER